MTWDGSAAMSKAAHSDHPAAAYRAICAGRKAGDPEVQSSWALPHHATPGGPPDPDAVRNALARLPQTQGLTNTEAARRHLQAHLAEINRRSQSVTNEPVEIRSAIVSAVDFAQRIIDLIAVPYDEEAAVEHRGQILAESVAPGSFDGIETRNDHVTVNRDHDYGRTIGKAVSYDTRNPRGLVSHLRISDTPLGDESLRLAADGVLKASVGMVVRRSDQIIADGKRRIKRAFLDHIALVPNPAYLGADILAVRQAEPATDIGPLPSTPNLDSILALLAE